MNWYEIYLKEIESIGNIDKYIAHKIKTKKILIDLIIRYSPNKKTIETGSGTGVLSTYLASVGYNATAVDIDSEILDLSRLISLEFGSEKKPYFVNKSIFSLDYEYKEFDVAFSNGVLEHFPDDDIINLIANQLEIANTVIFGIPTKYFDFSEAMFGDERYLDLSHWRYLIKMTNGFLVEEKSYHFKPVVKRIADFKKYFRPNPYRIFVVK